MSHWRVEQHYGFGAAQIPIRAEPHASAGFGMVEGFGYLLGEVVAGGPIATARRLAGQMPAILLIGLMFVAFVVTLSRDRSDQSPIEVVLFESLDEVAIPVPEMIPEVIPEKIVEVPTPLPPPPPVQVAKVEPPKPKLAPKPMPPPPPAPVARPKPKVRPKPALPQIARVEAPKVAPAPRIDRTTRERREAIARPKVKVDLAANQPKPAPTIPRTDRAARASVSRPAPPRVAPRLTAPAAPAFDQPQDAPTRESFRVANAKPTSNPRARALPGMAAAPKYTAPPSSDPASSRRRPSAAPAASARARRPAPSLDRAPVPTATAAPTRARASRPAPRAPVRQAARPVAEMASASAPLRPTAMPELASRSARSTPTTGGSPRGQNDDRPGLAGVPLGDLAACLTDREEDRLKQAVVAAVKTQEECVSSKGTYRFIETKNLNAFLMWIDRAPSRAISDRCVELSYALECLQSASQRAAR